MTDRGEARGLTSTILGCALVQQLRLPRRHLAVWGSRGVWTFVALRRDWSSRPSEQALHQRSRSTTTDDGAHEGGRGNLCDWSAYGANDPSSVPDPHPATPNSVAAQMPLSRMAGSTPIPE
jgi:hypothetical protein